MKIGADTVGGYVGMVVIWEFLVALIFSAKLSAEDKERCGRMH